uniref:Serine/threonine-protein phosphatase 2A activator n=1 Tax=Molossus molossus TaxID=27622 RepID=A0A7J8EGQ7_MOLMO|nr:protein phosphatase 2 phosphatase activator [Molossus molossus]
MAEGERQSPPGSSEDTPAATQNFIIPKKEIHTVPDMGKWKRSQAYADYIGFILTLNEGVKGKKLTFEYKVSEMKTGPFAEHSNQLWNISAVPTWSKVNQGLIRMYKAECLEKFPVIQHFKFGSLLPIHPVSLC